MNLFEAAMAEARCAIAAAQADSRVAWAMKYDDRFAERVAFGVLTRSLAAYLEASADTAALLDKGVTGTNLLVLEIAQGAIRDATDAALKALSEGMAQA